MIRPKWGSVFIGCLTLCLSACQAYWDPAPDFGSTINGAVVSQLNNPNAPKGTPTSVKGMDGGAAKRSIDAYEKSFERKTVQQNTNTTGTMTGSAVGITVQ